MTDRLYRIPWPEHRKDDPGIIRVTSQDGSVWVRVLIPDDPNPLPAPPDGWTLLVEDESEA